MESVAIWGAQEIKELCPSRTAPPADKTVLMVNTRLTQIWYYCYHFTGTGG